MSIDFERQLRASLRARAASPLLVNPDPYTAFSLREHHHRQARRTRRVVLVLGSAGLIAAASTGVLTLPDGVEAIGHGFAHHGSTQSAEPTLGSLAADTAWLGGLRRQVAEYAQADASPGSVVDPDSLGVRFAGTVDGVTLALLTVPAKPGSRDRHQTVQWFQGPVNATPVQMISRVQAPAAPTLAEAVGGMTSPGHLVVIAPPGALIRISLGVEFGADGRVHRTWTTPPSTDGLAIVTVPPSAWLPHLRVLVTRNGQTLFDAPPTSSWDRLLVTKGIAQASDGARGSGVDEALATRWINYALADAGLDLTAHFRLRWTGTVHGEPTGLLQITSAGGGSLFYVVRGSGSQLAFDLRLLAPAKGAGDRPIAWRLPASLAGTATDPGDVAVVTPVGTARAEVVTAAGTTSLSLNPDGFARTQIPGSGRATIRAYGSDGRILGQMALPPPASISRDAPGEQRATRLVD